MIAVLGFLLDCITERRYGAKLSWISRGILDYLWGLSYPWIIHGFRITKSELVDRVILIAERRDWGVVIVMDESVGF